MVLQNYFVPSDQSFLPTQQERLLRWVDFQGIDYCCCWILDSFYVSWGGHATIDLIISLYAILLSDFKLKEDNCECKCQPMGCWPHKSGMIRNLHNFSILHQLCVPHSRNRFILSESNLKVFSTRQSYYHTYLLLYFLCLVCPAHIYYSWWCWGRKEWRKGTKEEGAGKKKGYENFTFFHHLICWGLRYILLHDFLCALMHL